MASYKDEDIFKILLATDCHLGYLENDPVRGIYLLIICFYSSFIKY